MAILKFILLVFSIPLASLYLETICLMAGSAAHILQYPYVISDSVLYGRLFQTSLFYQIPIILGGFSFIEESNILLSLIPIVYTKADTDKSTILTSSQPRRLWSY
jgi:hypothetical protein